MVTFSDSYPESKDPKSGDYIASTTDELRF